MSDSERSSLGNDASEKEAGCPDERVGASGRASDGLLILACLDAKSAASAGDLGPPRDATEIARLTGLSPEAVRVQLERLIEHGYVEETAGDRYRLS